MLRGKRFLRGLIVGLNGGQFISELLATVELPDSCQVDFGKPMLHFGMLLIRDHAISQLAFGGDMVSTFESACEFRQVSPANQSVPLGTLHVFLRVFIAPPDGGSQAKDHVGRFVSSCALLGVLPEETNQSNGIVIHEIPPWVLYSANDDTIFISD